MWTLALSGPCEDLNGKYLGGATVTSATSITPPWTSPGSSLSAPTLVTVPFCRVEAVVAPAVKFEVWMPPKATWNERLQGIGNGAFAGGIPYSGMGGSLTAGFAATGTDTGHVSGVFDASWAMGHPELIDDWARRGAHVMTVGAKAIMNVYYGKGPKFSYFSGCSGGGRQALREAQDFPDDYDGILAGAPARHETHMIPAMLWNATVTCKNPASYIPPSTLPIIANAVLARCDGLDGLVDGLLDDPRRCDFDPKSIVCANPATCITPAQAVALRKIYEGARTPDGRQIYPGFLMGGETGPSGWQTWITGAAPLTSFDFLVGNSFLTYAVFENPGWDWRTFNFDSDVAYTDFKVGYINGNNPDLTAFKNRGGKMIMYHGWADPAIAALDSIDYYEDVVAFMSGEHKQHFNSVAGGPHRKTQEFFRLFMMPGMQHCSGGPGPDRFDGLGALRQWVEQGVAPDKMIATHYTGNVADRSRPLCPYPEVARWTGTGSTDDAANFECELKGLDRADEASGFDHGFYGRNNARR
jgi:feruloyl esterase